jgi:hypothetical protein
LTNTKKNLFVQVFCVIVFLVMFILSVTDLFSDRVEPNYFGNFTYGIIVSIVMIISNYSSQRIKVSRIINTLFWICLICIWVIYINESQHVNIDRNENRVLSNITVIFFGICFILLTIMTIRKYQNSIIEGIINTILYLGYFVFFLSKKPNYTYEFDWYWVLCWILIISNALENYVFISIRASPSRRSALRRKI